MRKKPAQKIKIVLLSLAMVLILTMAMFRLIGGAPPWLELVGIVFSIIGGAVAVVSAPFARSGEGTLADSIPVPRKATSLLFLLTIVACIALAIPALSVSIAELALGISFSSLKGGVFAISMLSIVLLFTISMLVFKVNSVKTLDSQKAIIAEICRTINRWELSAPSQNCGSEEIAKSYLLLLEDICRKALRLASSTGNRIAQNTEDLCAALFLPVAGTDHFEAIAATGPSAYKNALLKLHPSKFKPHDFCQLYNKFHEYYETGELDKSTPQENLIKFRDRSASVISSTGVVYELERRISFENLYSKCLAFRFEFLDFIDPKERDLYKFQQLVGLPIGFFGRKAGVLLLLSPHKKRFYSKDSVYWILGDLFGVAINIGIQTGCLSRAFPSFSHSDLPSYQRDADTPRKRSLVALLNCVRYDFSVRCPCDISEQREIKNDS